MDISKVLSEGLNIPIELVVGIKFKTTEDERIFKSLIDLCKQEIKIEPKIESKVEFKIQPDVEIVVPKEPIIEKDMVEVVSIVSADEEKPRSLRVKRKKEPKIWQTQKISYRPIIGGDDKSRYGECGDAIVFRREKIHFITNAQELAALAKLDKRELLKTPQLRSFTEHNKPLVLSFISAYKEGKVKVRDLSPRQAPIIELAQMTEIKPIIESKPAEVMTKPTVIKPKSNKFEDKDIAAIVSGKKFMPVRGNRHLTYLDYRHMLFLKQDDILIQTTWREMGACADMTERNLVARLDQLFGDNKQKREIAVDFIDSLIAGRVRDPDADTRPMLGVETGVKKYSGGYEGAIEEINEE
jgi:hypothetical protein